MTDANRIAHDYLAVWNETDPAARRARIEALWAPGGATTHRLLEARGYDAIVQRVTGANDKWIKEEGFVFRPGQVLAHNEVIRLLWEMVPRDGGAVDTSGLSHLVLDRDGRILADCQFPPKPAEPNAEHEPLVEAYLAFWNEPSAGIRAEMARELWSPSGGHADRHGVQRGIPEILAEAGQVAAAFAAAGRVFRQDGPADSHHGAVRFDWIADDHGRPVASGYALLMLDGDGLIDRAYTFDDPEPRAALAA